ncbi:MAG: VanZ family protein [Flavobacteriales bacterium]|nr:VanZ family protein [Flavobacteriales bacterium]
MPKTFLFPTILWALVILALSLMPGKDLPSIDIDYIDKIGHAVVYGILAYLIYGTGVSFKIRTPILVAIIIPICYGILIELLQDYLSEDRFADIYDAIANAFGAIFVGMIQILRR